MKLATNFYLRDDVVAISRELLGKVLCTNVDGVRTEAVITETEAYAGITDKASHAYKDRRTKRTEPMYGSGGIAYIYLCYGIHHLFNVVTNIEGVPDAVLVRAGKPVKGIDRILLRRNRQTVDRTLMGGPGTISQALGIKTDMTGTSLRGRLVWIEDRGMRVPDENVLVGPRVGVDYAEEDAARPYRFVVTTLPDRARNTFQ